MTSKINVRESETDSIEMVFAGENVSFSVNKPVLDYGIEEDVKQIAELLQEIAEKSNAVAVKDLMTDIHSSLNVSDEDLNL